MNPKPEYLYHGSQYLFDIIKPQQAGGQCGAEALLAIYAAESPQEVIPFALPIRWYPDSPEGKRDFTCSGGRTRLLYGSLDPEGTGYIYKIKSEFFQKIDEWQWVSAKECVPVEITEIKVRDYLHTVEFSEEAAKIQKLLYGETGGS